MIPDIVHEATYPYPPELVWRAIAAPDALEAWLMRNDLREPGVGGRFRFVDRPRPFWDGVCECEIAEADAPRRFALRWGVGGKAAPSDVSWTLEPAPGGGTHVTFRHAGLTGAMGWIMKKGMDRGWRRMMEASIPFVLARLAAGRLPTRDEVAAELRRAR
ncbi:MAG TPA: SRPBCC domain-containing protein [Anaeromyxobacter sp.]